MTLINITPEFPVLNLSLMGYNYDWTTSVFLSSNTELTLPVSAYNNYTLINRVSSICPGFSGYPLSSYEIVDKNRINITIDSNMFTNNRFDTKYFDIIIAGAAGYTKLSDRNYLLFVTNTGIPSILLENGEYLLLESGGRLLLEQ